MLVSPSEPLKLRKLGVTSIIPEQLGVDYLLDNGQVGIQRKEVKDWVASSFDGRLAKELLQMHQLPTRVLILEGVLRWSSGGALMERWSSGFTRDMHSGLLFSVLNEGVWLVQTSNLDETFYSISRLNEWTKKEHHGGLARPKTAPNDWGTRSNRDWAVWVLQGFEGIGKELAGRLVDRFGLPLQWTITQEQLMQVEGIGKGRADKLWASLNNG